MVIMSFRTEAQGVLSGPNMSVRCTFGRGGVVTPAAKREGDGATPAGPLPFRAAFHRPDREPPPETALPCVALAPDDLWCDDPGHPAYNTHVKSPFPARAETLWREDRLYDLIIVLGWNDDPVIAGAGSAIFLHLARPDWAPTEGCIAIDRAAMLRILSAARRGDGVVVVP